MLIGTGDATAPSLESAPSTAERVADILRDRIAEGFFPPGTRLSEEQHRRRAGRLPQHPAGGVPPADARAPAGAPAQPGGLRPRPDRGRPRPTSTGCGDSSSARRCAAWGARRTDLRRSRRRSRRASRPPAADAWPTCSTANIRFHQALAGLADSPRTDELMRNVLAELRLAFHVMADPRRFHEPYLTRNREIIGQTGKGDAAGRSGCSPSTWRTPGVSCGGVRTAAHRALTPRSFPDLPAARRPAFRPERRHIRTINPSPHSSELPIPIHVAHTLVGLLNKTLRSRVPSPSGQDRAPPRPARKKADA